MAVFNYLIVAVILLQLSSFLAASPVRGTNNPSDDNIKQQLKEMHDYCSQPQKELLNIYLVLSDRYNGLLLTGDHSVSGLRDGDYEFSPDHVLIDRCNSKCSHIEGMTCEVVEEKNVQREFHFMDQEKKYHKLSVNEHTGCHCKYTS